MLEWSKIPRSRFLSTLIRTWLSTAGFAAFLILNLFVLLIGPPWWLIVYAVAVVLYGGTQLVSFFLCGRRWVRTPDEFVVPTLLDRHRRLAVPSEGIGIQKLPLGTLIIYLGDPWDRRTPRMSPNLCMSATDVLRWLPHWEVPTARRPQAESEGRSPVPVSARLTSSWHKLPDWGCGGWLASSRSCWDGAGESEATGIQRLPHVLWVAESELNSASAPLTLASFSCRWWLICWSYGCF